MKNLVILLLAFLFACSQNPKNTAASQDSLTSNPAGLSVAYVNVDSLNLYYKFYEEKAKELEEQRRRIKLELENRLVNWDRDRQNFEAQANAKLLSAKQVEEKQQELYRKQQEIQTYEASVSQGLQAKVAEVDKELYKRLNEFLSEYNREKKYAFILAHTEMGGPILYAESQYDITKEVVEGLNAKYEVEKQAAKAKK
jgi:outer membrane protein